MPIDQLATHLMRLEVFQDLAPEQLNAIARRAERIVYKTGQMMIADCEPGDAAVLLIAGDAVRLREHSNGTAFEPVEPGSLLGEMAMLIETEYSSTVMAAGSVRALRIRRDSMLELMLADPSLAEHFVQKIALRLNRIATELHRIESTLDGLEQTYGDQMPDGAVRHTATPAEIACPTMPAPSM